MIKLLALAAPFAAFALAQQVPIPKVTPVPTTAFRLEQEFRCAMQ